MVREEHGESSSSPNDSIIVLDLRKRGTGGGSFEATLSDGSSFFITESVRARYSLGPESVLSPVELEKIKDEAEYALCRIKALDLLSRSSHTRKQMELKLLKRGFAGKPIVEILNFLEKRGYIDDQDYAETWVQSRINRHPEGRSRLYAGLLRRGIHQSTADRVLNEIAGPETMAEAVRQAAEKILRKAEISEEMLEKRLRNRGFTHLEIGRYMNSRCND
jgi:regulatory protein